VKILLVGNYRPDGQHSMLGFAQLMEEGLRRAGYEVRTIHPPVVFGKLSRFLPSASKWLSYLDKFLLFPPILKRAIRRAEIVHICDHSSAMYVRKKRRVPHVVTCHDLLAVRGGLGEQTDCPASPFGVFLQRWITRGLMRADGLACDSLATLSDANRLLSGRSRPPLLLPIALRYEYKPLPTAERYERLKVIAGLDLSRPFVLHVGSSHRRKNREGILRAFAKVPAALNAQLVFAGQSLTPSQRELARHLNVIGSIVETGVISDQSLGALYSSALVFFFPSRFEGFGWPIIEGQACGCPVICSNRAPLPEVAGDGALIRDVDDEEGFAKDIERLSQNAELRSSLIERGFENVSRYKPETMILRYVSLYKGVLNQQYAVQSDSQPVALT
jgi:glycosyltransferase involved in cell wall biosynthesis